MKKIFQIVSILVLFIPSLACSLTDNISSIEIPVGVIYFHSTRNGNSEIFSYHLLTRRETQITNDTSNDFNPAIIPQSNQIGFVSDRGNGMNLWVIDNNDLNLENITDSEDLLMGFPNWSPDGQSIALDLNQQCSRMSETCIFDIFTMNADGSGIQNLTDTPDSEWAPMWSPDGKTIAFSSDRDGDIEVYVMNKDGSDVKQLTDNDDFDYMPRWSPDGNKIVFVSDRDGRDWDLYIMNADGNNQEPLTNNSSNDYFPYWSPDGKWIVYVSDNDGDDEIYIVDTNGQNQRRLTRNHDSDSAPVWVEINRPTLPMP